MIWRLSAHKGILFFFLWIPFLFSCSSGENTAGSFVLLPQVLEDSEMQLRKRDLCSQVSFEHDLLNRKSYLTLFDCLNYDDKFKGISPLLHSESFDDFARNLMESVHSISDASKNIKQKMEPWFQEDENGESPIDELLPSLASLIHNSAFRTSLPLVAQTLNSGKDIWSTALPPLSLLVYDPEYPRLYKNLSYLFSFSEEKGRDTHFAKDFFVFLEKKNVWQGEEKTNALLLLELVDGLSDFKYPEHGFLDMFDDANSLDVFGTIYQEAGGEIRGEYVLPALNGCSGNGDMDVCESNRREKVKKFLSPGKNSPVPELFHLIYEFNQPLPGFMDQVLSWLSSPEHIAQIHGKLFDFFVTHGVDGILDDISISDYFDEYIEQQESITKDNGKICDEDLWYCEITLNEFQDFIKKSILEDEFFSEFFVDSGQGDSVLEELIAREFESEYSEGRNSKLLYEPFKKHLLTLFRNEEMLSKYTKLAFDEMLDAESEEKTVVLEELVVEFSRIYLLDNGENTPYKQLKTAWLSSVRDAWGASIVVDNLLVLGASFLKELMGASYEEEKYTLMQWFYSSTYRNPATMEKIIHRLRMFDLLNKGNMEWMKETLLPKIFKGNDKNLKVGLLLLENVDNYVLFVESGFSRSLNILSRALSERDDGSRLGSNLVRRWVNVLAECYRTGWVEKSMPVWSDLVKMLYNRDDKNIATTNVWEANKRELHKHSDGTDALKYVLKALLRPRDQFNYHSSLGGEIFTATRPLFSEGKKDTERFLLSLGKVVQESDVKELNEIFSETSGNKDEQRKKLAQLMRDPNFTEVLISLSQLLEDKKVLPSLDFLREKINSGELEDILLLIRRLMGIRE